jgi:hypothetical protein
VVVVMMVVLAAGTHELYHHTGETDNPPHCMRCQIKGDSRRPKRESNGKESNG